MLRLPLLFRPFPLLLLLTLQTACGTQKTDHRSGRPNTSGPVETTPETTAAKPADAAQRPAKPSTEAKTPAKDTTYDETLDRTASLFFYQAEPTLSDLFAPNGTSQLCWPTALSYTLESLRTKAEAPLSKLAKPTVRGLFAACGTDRKAGTTLPQGVTCADKQLSDAGYAPALKVSGLDAKWKDFGLYPAATQAEGTVVSPQVLRRELNAGASVILFIGYYRLDRAKNIWTRARGHFMSITGFSYRAEWEDEVLDLHVVNPAANYRAKAPADVLKPDLVRMSRIGDWPAALPAEVAFELRGPHFVLGDDAVAAVESVLTIQPN